MFGKRRQDHKHRSDEDIFGETPENEPLPDADTDDADDPELRAALLELGRNRHAPLREPNAPAAAAAEPAELLDAEEKPVELAHGGAPTAAMFAEDEPEPAPDDELPILAALNRERAKAAEQDEALQRALEEVDALKAELDELRSSAPESSGGADVESANGRVEELERTLEESQSRVDELTSEVERLTSTDAGAQLKAERERADEFERSHVESQVRIDSLTAELDELRAESGDADVVELRAAAERADRAERSFLEAQVKVASLTAELERVRSHSSSTAAGEVRAADGRADAAEKSMLELQAKVSALTVDLERTRSEAAAAGVTLERVERESKDQDRAVAAAEERAEQLAAELERLRAEAAKGPEKVERLRREAEREKALRASMDQAQTAAAQVEAVVAENRQLASQLAANLHSQEGLIAALTGLQTEVTEQRAWFEAQIDHVRQSESEQGSVVESLQAALNDRDTELELLRQQLLDAESKRAEEAAAFVAALERP